MEAIAKTKYLKGSPRKARLVIDLIRGVNVSRALSILKFTDKRAADPIAQCLNSAIANATYKAEQQNIAIDPDDLWVKTCFVDMGPTKGRRRMRPAPQGRAYREQRHYCHITIQVTSDEQPKTEKELKGEAAKARRAAEPRTDKKKAKGTPKQESNKAKVEEVETPTPAVEAAPAPTADTTPVETAETPVQSGNDAAEQISSEGDAHAADAKDTTTQNPAELNETKRADEKQLDTNEQLERQ